jgi:hypothetical protein
MEEKEQLSLVSYGQAKRLNAVGFDWECSGYYWKSENRGRGHEIINHNKYDDYSAPTVALALKWFRDERNLTGLIARNATDWYFEICKAGCGTSVYFSPDSFCYEDGFETYESAESTLLDELLTILEKEEEK